MEKDLREIASLIFREGCNEHEDGCCRTIKNQYYKNSISNFESQGTFGASGEIEIWKLKR